MLEANAQLPIHADPGLMGNGPFEIARFKENCFCSSFICAEFIRTPAGVKLFSRPGCNGNGATPRVPSQPQRGCVPKPRVARH